MSNQNQLAMVKKDTVDVVAAKVENFRSAENFISLRTIVQTMQ
ncbi:hypothetical protein [Bacillus sp. FJAT-49736]|nr:hypothetical protein [Bacillus sp. FJAT-49736]